MTDQDLPARAIELRQHELKTWPEYFEPVFDGRKTFELRKNDRDFREGDELWLREWHIRDGYTGRECWRIVTYAMSSLTLPFGVHIMSEGYVILGLRESTDESKGVRALVAEVERLRRDADPEGEPTDRVCVFCKSTIHEKCPTVEVHNLSAPKGAYHMECFGHQRDIDARHAEAALTALRAEQATLKVALEQQKDAAEMLWVVLANVSGGNWEQQSEEWQEAAARWRDNYFAALAAVPSQDNRLDLIETAETDRAEPIEDVLRLNGAGLNAEQLAAAKLWAADDRLWTTQETVEFNLRTFARAILAKAVPSQETKQ